MNPVTIFLTIGSLYLAVIAYGVVRTRQRGLPPRLRLFSAAMQVLLPPILLAGVMSLDQAVFPLNAWGPLLGLLALAGFFLALCTDIVARRVL